MPTYTASRGFVPALTLVQGREAILGRRFSNLCPPGYHSVCFLRHHRASTMLRNMI